MRPRAPARADAALSPRGHRPCPATREHGACCFRGPPSWPRGQSQPQQPRLCPPRPGSSTGVSPGTPPARPLASGPLLLREAELARRLPQHLHRGWARHADCARRQRQPWPRGARCGLVYRHRVRAPICRPGRGARPARTRSPTAAGLGGRPPGARSAGPGGAEARTGRPGPGAGPTQLHAHEAPWGRARYLGSQQGLRVVVPGHEAFHYGHQAPEGVFLFQVQQGHRHQPRHQGGTREHRPRPAPAGDGVPLTATSRSTGSTAPSLPHPSQGFVRDDGIVSRG